MNRNAIAWLGIFLIFLAWSAYEPHDRVTWWLEVAPALIGFLVIVWTRHRFPLTPVLYILILVHCVILMVGGHYTYAEVPAGEWVQAWTGSNRNNYDKLGHFAQGFVPAVIAREILVRKQVVRVRAWMPFLVVSVCLAVSAFYELLEWVAAIISSEAAQSFLGTQGYVWDTQSDMMWALLGAVLALVTLSGLHDRQLARLGKVDR